MTDWGHIWEMAVTALAGSVPVLIYIATNKRQAKADVERRHQENQKLVSELVTERKYFPAHAHSEKTGPLHAEGINYPPEE